LSLVIHPEIFERARAEEGLTAFFTGRDPGLDVSGLTNMPVHFPIQEHTSLVSSVTDIASREVADAVVTGKRGILLGLRVADCVPILLYDGRRKAVGAVHAGWRGTAAGILKNTIAAMVRDFGSDPRDIAVAIGPAIRWCCYEVGREVLDPVVRATGGGDYHMEKNGRLCLDLPSANKYQALSVKIEVENIDVIEECTYCHPDRYFSYRYAKGPTGRQGGFIGIP
jgi:YfiH family protein